MSGALGKSESSSSSVTNPSRVWGSQAPYLQGLYEKALPQLDNRDYYSQNIQNLSMPSFLRLSQGGYSPDQTSQFAQDPRLSNLTGLASGQTQNQALGGAIQAGLGDISRNFRQSILPGINTGAAMTNTAGGSRQGIAQGLASSAANRQASDFVNRMRSQNYQTGLNTQLGALGQIGGLEGMRNQFGLSQDQLRASIAQQQNQAAGSALGMAPQLAGMGIASQWAPFLNLSQVLGPPTVLGGGGSSSGSSSRLDIGGFG